MALRFVLVFVLLTLLGCSGEKSEVSAASAAPPEISSTLDRPEETKLDQKTSLANLDQDHGLKAYPGASEVSAEVFKRGDGGTKYVVQFTTKDSTKKVTEFYKQELKDGKVDDKGVGTSMGMTKANGSVIAIAEPGENGAKVKITLISYSKS